MKKIVLFVIALFTSVLAYAAKPSDAMLEELFRLTRVEKIMEPVYDGIEQNMRLAMKQAYDGKPLSKKQKLVLESMPRKFSNFMRSEFGWEKIKPTILDVYRESFSVEEVIAMIEFYRTPVGQSIIEKMPKVMQLSMLENQKMIQQLAPRLMEEMGKLKDEIDRIEE